MPWTVSFDETVDCCFVRWTGALDLQGLWGYMRAVVGEPWYRPGLNVLHDFRDATAAPPATDVLQLAQNFRAVVPVFGNSGRVALIVPKVEDFPIAQTFVGLAGGTGREFEVFTDLGEARMWLGLPDDYELPAD